MNVILNSYAKMTFAFNNVNTIQGGNNAADWIYRMERNGWFSPDETHDRRTRL